MPHIAASVVLGQLTATAGVNAGFIGGGDLGGFVGIGYNIGR